MAFEPTEYSNVHRLFLQACGTHGTLSIADSLAILNPLVKKYGEAEMPFDVDKKVLNSLINTINTKILPFDQKIQHLNSFDLNDQEYLVFTYKSEISMNKFQTVYSESEVQYFRLLMKAIAGSEDLHIKTMNCINLTSKVPKLKANMKILSKTRAEDLLSEWTQSGYFLELENDIFFGPRMLSEFGVYLKTHFPENIVACHLCKNVIFAGIRCGSCNCMLHKQCIKKHLAKLTKCPSCKEVWSKK